MAGERCNRLIGETSPYLLQHAHNPVDWYPWGPEAFEAAQQENKPILLSIGYSACHWCHVMAHESFENEAIATLMNDLFVNIKVDREERPDLDYIYQNVVQILSGQGGWPLTMFLTPEQEPFYGGTYFPPDDRYGRPGFARVLQSVADAYHNRHADVTRSVEQIREVLSQLFTVAGGAESLTDDLMANAARHLLGQVDRVHGGFGSQPKFPNPSNLDVLLRYWKSSDNVNFLDAVTLSMTKMAGGGIYDQLGGGFHRYSVDSHWLVPHFEKMLYDNAQLLSLSLDLYRITGDALYERVARETLAYIRREMLHQDGGFYATQDADSEGEEGKFFVWTKAEVETLLGEDARFFCRYYDVTDSGNWEHGRNILHLTVSMPQLAKLFKQEEASIRQRIETGRQTLFAVREQRVKPFRDEKIITAWNGLMVSAMMHAYTVLGDADALAAGCETLAFLQRHMWRDGRLLRSYKDGQAKFDAYLDDYAFLSAALLDAFEATFNHAYFDLAVSLTNTMLEDFWDTDEGGLFFTGKHHERLITRTKAAFDQAMPSGASIATKNLLRLYHYTGCEDYLQRAEHVLQLFKPQIEQQPSGVGSLLAALDFYLHKPQEIVLIGEPNGADTQAMLRAVHRLYIPNKTLLLLAPQQVSESLEAWPRLRDVLTGKTQVDGRATVYVCHNFTCSLPITEPQTLIDLLTGA